METYGVFAAIFIVFMLGMIVQFRLDRYIRKYRPKNDYKTAERPFTEYQKEQGLEEIRRDLKKMDQKLTNTISYRKREN